jgi:hypothetical protein
MFPYITPPSKCGVTMCETRQEVSRSALVKGIELKRAASIWHAALGYLQWNCAMALHALVYAPPIDCNSHHIPST